MGAGRNTRGKAVWLLLTAWNEHPEGMPLTSPLLSAAGFRHAFFTREGGVSNAPFDSLNFSITVGDRPGLVHENFRLAAHSLGVAPSGLLVLSQVHGTRVIVANTSSTHDTLSSVEGDALIGLTGDLSEGDDADPSENKLDSPDALAPDERDARGIAVGVRSADCVPILVADRISGAVLAIHSGWKGTAADITGVAISALREQLGDEGDLIAAVGPHISLASFEVGDDVAKLLSAASPIGDAAVARHEGKKPHVDLRKIVAAQLDRAGVHEVDQVDGCTVIDAKLFFSYRRDGGEEWAVVVGDRGANGEVSSRRGVSSEPAFFCCEVAASVVADHAQRRQHEHVAECDRSRES